MVVPVIVWAAPLKITVPVPPTKPAAPLEFVQFPLTVNATAPDRVTEVVDPMEILLHTAAADIVGPVATLFGIVTLVIASGTDPHDQLPGVLHNPSAVPLVHSPGVQPLELTLTTPFEAATKYTSL